MFTKKISQRKNIDTKLLIIFLVCAIFLFPRMAHAQFAVSGPTGTLTCGSTYLFRMTYTNASCRLSGSSPSGTVYCVAATDTSHRSCQTCVGTTSQTLTFSFYNFTANANYGKYVGVLYGGQSWYGNINDITNNANSWYYVYPNAYAYFLTTCAGVGSCGANNGANFSALTAADASNCVSSPVTNFAGSGPWSWSCNNASCSANLKINGVCGTASTTPANHAIYSYTGSTNVFSGAQLCSAGTLPASQTLAAAGGSTVSWTCAQQNGGNPASCTAAREAAPVPVNGVCANDGAVYSYTGSTNVFTGASLCSAGDLPASQTLAAPGGSTASWTCGGQNGGTSDSCSVSRVSAVAGVCGPAVGSYLSTDTAYSGALCSAGNLVATPVPPLVDTTFPTTGNATNWTCGATNGGASSPTCTATRAVAPGVPSSLVLTATAISTAEIDLSWTVPYNGGSAITGYKIERSSDGANWSTLVANTASTASTYQDIGFIPLPLGTANGATSTWFCEGAGGGSTPTCIATRSGNKPTVSALTRELNLCTDPLTLYPSDGTSGVTFGWVYGGTSTQLGATLEVYDNSSYSAGSKVWNYTIHGAGSGTSVNVVPGTPSTINHELAFNKTYYWQVAVNDEHGDSDWVRGALFTTLAHAWPHAKITYTPPSAIIKYPVYLDATGSACYGASHLCKYDWILNDGTQILDSAQASFTSNLVGTYTQTLTVTDLSDPTYMCTVTKDVPVKNTQNVPTWKEISPF
jgi:hypothetical protein